MGSIVDVALVLLAALAGFLLGLGVVTGAGTAVCHQWAGKSAVIYDGKCMVRTKDGGLRPARKDGGE